MRNLSARIEKLEQAVGIERLAVTRAQPLIIVRVRGTGAARLEGFLVGGHSFPRRTGETEGVLWSRARAAALEDSAGVGIIRVVEELRSE